MTERTARCHCGDLEVSVSGDPVRIAMCHCTLCQRRTGSLFHVAAWYLDDQIETSGEVKTYYREGDDKWGMTYHFCPNCGTSVYWRTPIAEGATGIAVGCFADPEFPMPGKSIYGECRHKWLTLPEELPSFDRYGE